MIQQHMSMPNKLRPARRFLQFPKTTVNLLNAFFYRASKRKLIGTRDCLEPRA